MDVKRKGIWTGRLVALVLCAALVLTAAVPAQAAISFVIIEPASRGQVSEFLLAQAKKYRPEMTMGDIIKGYGDGDDLRESKDITRLEALVMVSRAFGKLPVPVGGMAIMAPQKVSFNDTPMWAEAEIANILDARILTDARPLDEMISLNEVRLIVQRIHALYGSRPGDDFYQTVNKAYIEDAKPSPTFSAEDRFTDVARKTDRDMRVLVNEILSKLHGMNTPGQKIQDIFQNYMDFSARDRAGAEPIRQHLDAIKNAKTLDDLSRACYRVAEELAFDVLAGFGTTVDPGDSGRKIMSFATYDASQQAHFYQDPHLGTLMREHYASLLTLAGYDAAYANRAAGNAYSLEAELAKHQMLPQDYYNPDKYYNVFAMGEVKAMVPRLDLDRVLRSAGYRTPDKVMVMDLMVAEAFGRMYVEENLEMLADGAMVKLLCGMGPFLGTGFERASIAYERQLYGIDGELPDEMRALYMIMDVFGDYLAPLYAERYFTREAKAGVEQMCKELIAAYKSRIRGLDWMSDKTKEQAVEKLDKMGINIGYPAKYDTKAVDRAVIKGPDEGGAYFQNIMAVRKAYRDVSGEEQLSPPDMAIWPLQPFSVNAYYYPSDNSINFPAAILQLPFYDPGASKEANYGSIGIIIAHEITHAFDDNGAKYDASGRLRDWWEEEDYAAFANRLGNVVRAYHGYEVSPGIAVNGALTLSENVADLGGIAGALDVLGAMQSPDYDAFFRSYAVSWGGVWVRGIMEYQAVGDVHSMNKARVNVGFGQFAQFYDTYGLTADDMLYVAPELRAGVW